MDSGVVGEKVRVPCFDRAAAKHERVTNEDLLCPSGQNRAPVLRGRLRIGLNGPILLE